MMNEQDEIKKCYAIMYQAMIQKKWSYFRRYIG